MASFDLSYKYLMSWEDPTGSGVVTTDNGGRTRFGWAERYNPELTLLQFYTLPVAQAAVMAENRVLSMYWNAMRGDSIVKQDLADYLLSIGFNNWLPTVVRWMQEELQLPQDGIIGPNTLNQMNLHWAQALSGIYIRAKAKYSAEPPNIRAGLLRRAYG